MFMWRMPWPHVRNERMTLLPGPAFMGSVCLWVSWEKAKHALSFEAWVCPAIQSPWKHYYTVHLHTHLPADPHPTRRNWGGLGTTSSSHKEVWGTLASSNLPDGSFLLGCSRCGLWNRTFHRNRTFHSCLCLSIHPSSHPTPRKPCAWTAKASEVPIWLRNDILDI